MTPQLRHGTSTGLSIGIGADSCCVEEERQPPIVVASFPAKKCGKTYNVVVKKSVVFLEVLPKMVVGSFSSRGTVQAVKPGSGYL